MSPEYCLAEAMVCCPTATPLASALSIAATLCAHTAEHEHEPAGVAPCCQSAPGGQGTLGPSPMHAFSRVISRQDSPYMRQVCPLLRLTPQPCYTYAENFTGQADPVPSPGRTRPMRTSQSLNSPRSVA